MKIFRKFHDLLTAPKTAPKHEAKYVLKKVADGIEGGPGHNHNGGITLQEARANPERFEIRGYSSEGYADPTTMSHYTEFIYTIYERTPTSS